MLSIDQEIENLEIELNNKKQYKKMLQDENYYRENNKNDDLINHIFTLEYGTSFSNGRRYMLKYLYNNFQFKRSTTDHISQSKYKSIHITTNKGVVSWFFFAADVEIKESKGFYFVYIMGDTHVLSKIFENKDGSL